MCGASPPRSVHSRAFGLYTVVRTARFRRRRGARCRPRHPRREPAREAEFVRVEALPTAWGRPSEWLVKRRSAGANTTAAGGGTNLMTIGGRRAGGELGASPGTNIGETGIGETGAIVAAVHGPAPDIGGSAQDGRRVEARRPGHEYHGPDGPAGSGAQARPMPPDAAAGGGRNRGGPDLGRIPALVGPDPCRRSARPGPLTRRPTRAAARPRAGRPRPALRARGGRRALASGSARYTPCHSPRATRPAPPHGFGPDEAASSSAPVRVGPPACAAAGSMWRCSHVTTKPRANGSRSSMKIVL